MKKLPIDVRKLHIVFAIVMMVIIGIASLGDFREPTESIRLSLQLLNVTMLIVALAALCFVRQIDRSNIRGAAVVSVSRPRFCIMNGGENAPFDSRRTGPLRGEMQ